MKSRQLETEVKLENHDMDHSAFSKKSIYDKIYEYFSSNNS